MRGARTLVACSALKGMTSACPVPKLSYPHATNGFLALSKRVRLSHAEAKERFRELLASKPLPDPTSADHGHYLTAASPFTQAEADEFLTEFAASRKLLNASHEPELREDLTRRSIYYWGVEVLRLDKATGCILSTAFARPFVTGVQLSGLRLNIGKSWALQALQTWFGLTEDDLVVGQPWSVVHEADPADCHRRRVEAIGHFNTTQLRVSEPREKGLPRVGRNPAMPEAMARLFKLDSVLKHKLFRPEAFGARAAAFTRMLWRQVMDPEVASLTARSCFSAAKFTFDDYNQVAWHRALYVQVAAESPGLLPVLHAFLGQQTKARRWAKGAGVRGNLAKDFHGLRGALMAAGVFSKADWKALLHVGPQTLKSLLSLESSEGYLPSYTDGLGNTLKLSSGVPKTRLPVALAQGLSLIAEGRRLQLPLRANPQLGRMLSQFSVQGDSQALDTPEWQVGLLRFKQLFLAAQAERVPEPRALRKHLLLDSTFSAFCNALDWLKAEGLGAGLPDKHSTWTSLMRRSDAWHHRIAEENARRAKEEAALHDAEMRKLRAEHANPNGDGWNPRLAENVIDGVRVRPLHTSEMLADEGERQHHCVYGYADNCWAGSTLIFSLQDEADPSVRSTLEVRCGRTATKGKGAKTFVWRSVQLRAACNQLPAEHHAAVAERVARELTALESPR